MHNATVHRNSTLIIVGEGPVFDLTIEEGGVCVIAPTKEDAEHIISCLVNAGERALQTRERRRGQQSGSPIWPTSERPHGG